MAAASSCGVIAIAAAGALTAPLVAAALGVACALAVFGYRAAQPERPLHVFHPLNEAAGPVVIRAPRAGDTAGAQHGHTDAA